MLTLVVAAAAVVALAGCRRSERTIDPAPAGSATPAPPPGPRKLGPITVDEARPLLPAATDFTAVRTVSPPVKSPNQERVITFLCFDGATVDDAARHVRARLQNLGWTSFEEQDQVDEGTPKRVITSRRPPFNLTGELVRTDAPAPEAGVPECLAARGQTLVLLIVYRLVPVP